MHKSFFKILLCVGLTVCASTGWKSQSQCLRLWAQKMKLQEILMLHTLSLGFCHSVLSWSNKGSALWASSSGSHLAGQSKNHSCLRIRPGLPLLLKNTRMWAVQICNCHMEGGKSTGKFKNHKALLLRIRYPFLDLVFICFLQTFV